MSSKRFSDRREKMTAVTKAHPCPVCEGDHKCSVGDAGLILCGRREGKVSGFRHYGPSNGDPQFHVYRRGDDPPAPVVGVPPKSNTPRDWNKLARTYAGRFDADARTELAARLDLPADTFTVLPLLGVRGQSALGRTFTLPECSANGLVVGITTRAPQADGSDEKKMMLGGRRGLTIPDGWHDRRGPVFLVEGPSDALAMSAAGLAAIGRPSNTGGVAHLAALLRDVPPDRPILVVGENDQKGDGNWPGRVGAERTAAALRSALKRPVLVSMTPRGAKDVRQWLGDRVRAGVDWEGAGREPADMPHSDGIHRRATRGPRRVQVPEAARLPEAPPQCVTVSGVDNSPRVGRRWTPRSRFATVGQLRVMVRGGPRRGSMGRAAGSGADSNRASDGRRS